MKINPMDLTHRWYSNKTSYLDVDLGLIERTEVSIYNPDDEPVSQYVLDTLSHIKANVRTIHQHCRKLIFDYVQKAANDDNSCYDFDVGGDWDLLEILEDGESAELIEDYIGLDCIEFGTSSRTCRIHYKTVWDDHGMSVRLENQALTLL